jgi:hypothetical protein
MPKVLLKLAFFVFVLKGCPGWGANPGSFLFHLFSHLNAEQQRLPSWPSLLHH